jgi:hypothetical protein
MSAAGRLKACSLSWPSSASPESDEIEYDSNPLGALKGNAFGRAYTAARLVPTPFGTLR